MSTTSTVITIVICVVLVCAIGLALIKGLWSASKKITLPIQIALFVVMLVCVIRLFCTRENAQKLYKGIEDTGISQNMESTMRTALKLPPAESKPAEEPVAPAEEPVATPVPVEVKPTPAPVPQPVAVPVPEPVKAVVVDYGYLDKGKKSFSYALPFDAKVTVGFKDNTYRVIVESLGTLSASDKKEVGRMILTSVGKYAGRTIEKSDKAKIQIETRYDAAEDRTRVFAIIPPDAIE